MKSKRFFAVATLIVIGMLVAGIIWLNRNRPQLPEHIILISIDTLRADHLSCYGYEHPTTPNIDAFSKDAVLFENCFANIPLTLPSHASMLTGVIPPTHGVHANEGMVLSDSVLTLPEILQRQGYSTYGIISAAVLDTEFGLAQGFDVYDDNFDNEVAHQAIGQRLGDETMEHALKWLQDNLSKKKFMFIHFFDPHMSYTPPTPYDKKFRHPYDGEIAFTDHCVGQIIDKLKSLGLYDDSLIVITGDHAEMLGEHEESTHGYYIYHNALRVPLIIKPAGVLKHRRVTDNTTLIDVTPTILSQSGIEIPPHIQGVNLSNYFIRQNYSIPDRAIFNQSLTPTKYNGNTLLGLIYNQWHYIQTTRPELYDHVNDPQELNNLINAEPQRARILQDKLKQIVETSLQTPKDASIEMTRKMTQTLESLGYVGGAVDTDFTFDQTREDPKDLLRFHEVLAIDPVSFASSTGYDLVIQSLNQILKERPDIAPTYEKLAKIYAKLESYDKAINILRDKLKLLPDNNAQTYYLLGVYHHQLKDHSKALANCLKTLELDPDHVKARISAAEIYKLQGKLKEAVEHYKIALILDPDQPFQQNDVAWIQATQKDPVLYDPPSALLHAQKAVELSLDQDSPAHDYYPHLLDTLSAAQAANEQFEAAVETATAALKLCQERGLTSTAESIQKHLTFYQQHKAYRE